MGTREGAGEGELEKEAGLAADCEEGEGGEERKGNGKGKRSDS